MVALLAGMFALTVAGWALLARDELVEARLKGVERLGWWNESRKSAYVTLWIAVGVFLAVGVVFLVVGVRQVW
ncbi:MAG: hypothetical protein WD557_19270 [Dehalococcoidia bacterium]